jgi:hypothetical protein
MTYTNESPGSGLGKALKCGGIKFAYMTQSSRVDNWTQNGLQKQTNKQQQKLHIS